MTKLAYYSDKVMEWCWLAALVFTPLYFNVYSSRVFEPDKLALLRTIALIGGVAWSFKIFEGMAMRGTAAASNRGGTATAAGWPASRWWQIPMLLPILIYALLYLFSSLTSVNEQASIFGSYQRLQGLISQYAYILIALTIIFNLRRREQIERIVTFAIATSVPVTLYGLLQHEGMDPLPWAGDVTQRVASTMGNAIFVAAWLIMVVPLMLYRIANLVDGLFNKNRSDIEAQTREGETVTVLGYAGVFLAQNFVLWIALMLISGVRDPNFALWFIFPTAIFIFYLMNFIYGTARKGSRWMAYAQLGGLVVLMLLTMLIILYTQSRGPLLGLIAGIVVFTLAIFWAKKMRVPLIVSGVLIALVFAFLVLFNLPDSPLAGLRDVKYIGRLGQIFETQDGTGRVRLLIWQGAENLITSDPVRMIIGYGPESMYVAYNKYYPADLQHWELRNATPDRSHNAYIDQAVTMGLLGEAAWLFLIGSFFFFFVRALRRTKSFASQALILGLASGVLAHLVEILVGIQIAVTYTYFYTYIAVFVALTFFIEKTLQPQLKASDETDSGSGADDTKVTVLARPKQEQPAKEEVGVMSRFANALRPRTLALAGATNAGSLQMNFASSNGSNRNGSGSSNGANGSNPPRKGSGNRNKNTPPPTRAAQPQRPVNTPTPPPSNRSDDSIATNGDSPSSNLGTPVTPMPRPQSQLQRTGASSSASRQRIASGRVDQSRMRAPIRWFANSAYVWVYAVILIVALIFIYTINVGLVYADMLYKQGQSADQQQVWPQSVQYYQQAINLQPDQDYYYLFLGRAYMEWAKNPARFQQMDAQQSQQARDQLIAESERTLLKARDLNPMNTDHYANLGRLYVYWGGSLGQNEATKQQGLDKLKTGIDNYKHATDLSPQNAQIWNEYALAQRSLALYLNQLNPPAASASTTVTSTGTVTDTTGSGAAASANGSVLNQPAPKRGDSLNPDALAALEQAEQTIDHTITKVDDKFANSYYIKGEIERSLSDPQKAADAYVKMITLVPVGNDSPSLAALADNEITQRSEFLASGRVYTEVIEALKSVTTKPATPDTAHPEYGLYADSKDAHNVLGFLYWKSGQLPPAITELNKVSSLDASDYFAHRNLGVLYGLNKQPQEQLNELAIGRNILNGSSQVWSRYFTSQQEHDQELASVNATIQQVEQENPGMKAPAAPSGNGAPAPSQP